MKRYELNYGEPKYDDMISYRLITLIDTLDNNLPIKSIKMVPSDNMKAWLIEPLADLRDRLNDDYQLYTEEVMYYASPYGQS